mgnify:CR=1 FL=1
MQNCSGLGVRAVDSLNRWASIKTHGPVNQNRCNFFPIYDWRKERLLEELVRAGVPVRWAATHGEQFHSKIIRHRAAVRMIGERFQRHLQHGMAAPSLDVGHKTDAARIVFVARVIQPSCRGQLAFPLERATGILGDVYRFGFVHSCVLPHLATSTGAPCHQPGQR